MLRLRADGFSANLMWLSYYEGRLSTLQVSADLEMVNDIATRARQMDTALRPEAPASARQYAYVAQLVTDGTTIINLVRALGNLSTSLRAELAQRSMVIGMPGEALNMSPPVIELKPHRAAESPAPPALPPPERTKGGRPAGKDGEPIARVTKRLLALNEAELGRCTAESVGTELVGEYTSLGLSPPSFDNAKRNASGILRSVQN